MPNWCGNTVTIRGEDDVINRVEQHLKNTNGKSFFDAFVPPCPNDNWYEYNVENYGCKWNCDAYEWERSGDSIFITFDSPWAPPIQLYETMEEQGLAVDASYSEPGCAFVGRFVDGEDEYYEYTDIESLDDIPEELVESWGLREMMEEWDHDE